VIGVVGIFFVLPCIESYTKVDLRTVSFDVPPQEVSIIISAAGSGRYCLTAFISLLPPPRKVIFSSLFVCLFVCFLSFSNFAQKLPNVLA